MHTLLRLENMKGRDHSENQGEDNIGLDLRETGWISCGPDSCDSGYGPLAGPCEHGNEPTDSTKGGEFLD